MRVKVVKRDNTCILTVKKMNQISYKGNAYEVISDENIEGMQVKVVETDGIINIYKPIVNELICSHEILAGQGRVTSYLQVFAIKVKHLLQ